MPTASEPTVCESDFADAIAAGKSYAPRTFRQWIESELIIPDGPFRGERFRIQRQPAHGPWIDAVDDPQWTDCVFTAVTQFGKSLLAHVCPILYHVCELGQSVTWALPTADMADTKWQQDFRPVMEANPRLRRLLPTRGSGSRGGKVRDMITLANGAILKIQSVGTDDSAKGGFTSPIMGATEAAGFSKAGDASVEADPLRQARARQRAYKRTMRRAYIEGTLTVEDELPWTLYAASTKSQLVAPCPHCAEFIHPTDDHLVGWREADSEVAAIKRSHWICPKCRRKITESQRARALRRCCLVHDGQKIDRDGRITGPSPESTRLWYHATPFFNLLLEPGDIGAEEWATEQIPEDSAERIAAEKERAQFRWAKIYRPPRIDGQIELDRESLAQRQNDLAQNQLPDDVSLVAIGIDTGDRRGWFAALAALPSGELIVPTYGAFDIPSEQARPDIAIHAALMDQMPWIRAGLPLAGGGVTTPHAVGCDAGHRQEATYQWSRDVNPRQRLDQWAMPMRGRGESQMMGRRWTAPKSKAGTIRQVDPDRTWYVEWVKSSTVFEMHFDADLAKLRVQHGMTMERGVPGSISLFRGTRRVHSRLARHLVNERLIYEIVPRRGTIARWHRFGDNHLLDCLAMAYVQLCRLGYSPPPLPKMHAADDGTVTTSDASPRAADGQNAGEKKTVDKHAAKPIQTPQPTQKATPKPKRKAATASKPAAKPSRSGGPKSSAHSRPPAADPARERVRRWINSIK